MTRDIDALLADAEALNERLDALAQSFAGAAADAPDAEGGHDEMTTETTATPPTETEITNAHERLAEIDRELRDPLKPYADGDPTRKALVDEKIRLGQVAYFQPPPTAPAGPTLEQQLAAEDEIRTLRARQMKIPEGDPRNDLINRRVLELGRIVHHDEIAAAESAEAWRDLAPVTLRGERWLPEVRQAAEANGVVGWGSILHVLAGELASGRVGSTDDDAIEAIREKYRVRRGVVVNKEGVPVAEYDYAHADAIIDAAQEAARHLPKAFRVFLDEKRLLASPALVEELGKAWLRRAPAENKDGLKNFTTALAGRIGGT